MSRSPQQPTGSKRYADSWRAVNELIRSDASWSGRERNACYRNNGDGKFTDIAFVSGLNFPADGRAFAAIDIDRDGDLDLILKSRTAPQVRIMRNDWGAHSGAGRTIEIELLGVESNRDAIGAQAALATAKRRLLRTVRAESGYLAQPSRRLHFALDFGEQPETLEIRWPGGARQTFSEIPDGHAFRITEGHTRWESLSPAKPRPVEPVAEAVLTAAPGTWLLDAVPAPDFSLENSDGGRFQLSAKRGKSVLVSFWATWCPPCREELAEFQSNRQAFVQSGVELAAVSVDDPADRERAVEFAAENGIEFPVLFADDETVAAYTVVNRHLFDRRRDLSLPSSFLIDEQGRIIKAYLGAASVSSVLADASSPRRPAIPFAGKWYSGQPGRDYVEMATAMAERGLIQPAQTLFEAAIAAGDTSSALLNNLASLLIEQNKFERAEDLLRATLRAQPNQADSLVNLGNLHLRQGKPSEAIEDLTKAIAQQPDDAAAYNTLGSAYFAGGSLPEAQQNFRRAVRMDDSNPLYRHNLGSVLAASGRFPEARSTLEEARALGGRSVKLSNDLGVVYMQTGHSDRALSEFQSALETEPSSYETHLNLAQYFFAAGDQTGARDWMNKARDLQPDNPSSYMLEAQFLAAEQRFVQARAVLQSYLTANPDFEPAQTMLNSLP